MEFHSKHHALMLGSILLLISMCGLTLAQWWQSGQLQYFSSEHTFCGSTSSAYEGGTELQITYKQHHVIWANCN
jgi:hypothetical protein